jgi:DNA-binding transcriptional MerR regulator
MQRKPAVSDFLETSAVAVPRFSTGEVSEILGVPIWRLQKFLDSPRYRLTPSGQIGKGKGSRRLFSTEDVYRLGIASFLSRDGFAPKLIFKVLETLENEDLLGFDQHGNFGSTGILFKRGAKGPMLDFFSRTKPPQIAVGGPIYYALDLTDVIRDIDRRIATLRQKQ